MKLKITVLSLLLSCSFSVSAQLQITNLSMTANALKLTWTHNQTNYIVQYRTSLVSGTWMNWTNVVLSTNNMTITNWNSSCYYRVKKVNVLNFPDTKFRSIVTSSILNKFYPTNQIYDIDDLSGIMSVDLDSKGITNLTGLNYLSNLRTLSAVSNSITSIDLSGIPMLRFVFCSHNLITNVVTSQGLTSLDLNYNNIKNLTLTNYVEQLRCDNNGMTNLVIQNSYYYTTYISCCNNNFGNLLTFWGCHVLSDLYATGNSSLRFLSYWSTATMKNLHVDPTCTATGLNP